MTTGQLKRALFDHLLHRCYVKLAPSRIAGVGVRALCDIPPDTDPFMSPNTHLQPPEPPCIAVCEDEIAAFPAVVRSQLLSFFAVSARGLNRGAASRVTGVTAVSTRLPIRQSTTLVTRQGPHDYGTQRAGWSTG